LPPLCAMCYDGRVKIRFNFYKLLLALIDAAIINLSVLIALFIRFDGAVPFPYLRSYLVLAVPGTLIKLGTFYLFGLYHQIWAYASINALLSIAYAVSIGSLAVFVLSLLLGPFRYPYTVAVISWLVTLLLIGGSRLIWRVTREVLFAENKAGQAARRVLIMGAGDAGESILREILRTKNEYLVVGLLDDDPKKAGLLVHGSRVLGGRQDIPRLVKNLEVSEVLIAIPSAPGRELRQIAALCREARVSCRTLPPISEIIDGTVSLGQAREISAEDLLGREPIKFDLDEVRPGLAGKVILVTGAGGSIGSELCRQLSFCAPGKLVLLGQGEGAIYHINLELREKQPRLAVVPVIANIRDEARLNEIFEQHRPQLVFHAAAYKHVHLMEQNPDEARKNNVWGTQVVAEAALRHGAERFVLISTDKAVNPHSEMGRSKKAAEQIVLGLQGKGETRFMVTRFGNVLNSRGSVIPLFKRQIAQRRPVTVTDPQVVRFFMTIPEAVQLVVRAALLGQGGEIFVLDMGEPVRIADLARELIEQSGLRPGEDIPIQFIGLRQGEKLTEELIGPDEEVQETAHRHIMVARKK
jgi:FlaA1/EpsC-like NDP-sugar epimerase